MSPCIALHFNNYMTMNIYITLYVTLHCSLGIVGQWTSMSPCIAVYQLYENEYQYQLVCHFALQFNNCRSMIIYITLHVTLQL